MLDVNLLSDRIEELIEQRYLNRRYSDDGKLFNLCYSNKCIYDKKWNEITLQSRGHVYEVETGKLIAKAFDKFFNLSELPVSKSRNLIKIRFNCYEKVDGSLGIIFNYDDVWRMNTRGSFNSEQSIEGMKILKEKYDLNSVDKDLTLLVEIVYPENRIVVKYENIRELVLLTAYNRNSGKEISGFDLFKLSDITRMRIPKNFHFTINKLLELVKNHENPTDLEGFVFKFIGGERVKIKSLSYLKLSRIIESITYKNLSNVMKNGRVNRTYIYNVPEEFRGDLDKMVYDLEKEYRYIKINIFREYDIMIRRGFSRKEIGLCNDFEYKPGLFIILDDKPGLFTILDDKLDKLDKYIMNVIKRLIKNKEIK